MRRLYSVLTMMMLGAVALPACARTGRADPVERIRQADTNHDGLISRDEFMSARAARFDKMDRNHDGYLDDADLPRFVSSRAGAADKFHAVLQMADADHDGRVGHGEFVDGGSRMFGMIDANHDGVIDPDELRRASQRLQALAGK